MKDVIEVVLVFLLLTLNIFHNFFYFCSVSIVDIEQLNVRSVDLSINFIKVFWRKISALATFFTPLCTPSKNSTSTLSMMKIFCESN